MGTAAVMSSRAESRFALGVARVVSRFTVEDRFDGAAGGVEPAASRFDGAASGVVTSRFDFAAGVAGLVARATLFFFAAGDAAEVSRVMLFFAAGVAGVVARFVELAAAFFFAAIALTIARYRVGGSLRIARR